MVSELPMSRLLVFDHVGELAQASPAVEGARKLLACDDDAEVVFDRHQHAE